jgi:hypothetical protein
MRDVAGEGIFYSPPLGSLYVTPRYFSMWATRAAFTRHCYEPVGNLVNQLGLHRALPPKETAVDNKNQAGKLHIEKELSYEDLKTLGSAIANDFKDGGKSPRPLPAICSGAGCTK